MTFLPDGANKDLDDNVKNSRILDPSAQYGIKNEHFVCFTFDSDLAFWVVFFFYAYAHHVREMADAQVVQQVSSEPLTSCRLRRPHPC